MKDEIWVLAEEREGRLKPTSWEAVAAGQNLARALAKPLTAVVAGARDRKSVV